ncbi:hypothetical protein OH799_33015 [Nocardia sp. NBC_00881]|uniref:hypothetical protein n=1 Tax=Nocardia sp. NBC_00881 TaxID=2975995 RepID=UPI00386A3372|nr:hypothetical protein OH799_33015 [Nocardia sp. NBC_00881]
MSLHNRDTDLPLEELVCDPPLGDIAPVGQLLVMMQTGLANLWQSSRRERRMVAGTWSTAPIRNPMCTRVIVYMPAP